MQLCRNGHRVCHFAGIWHEVDKWFGCHKWDQLVCLTTFSLVGRGTGWKRHNDCQGPVFYCFQTGPSTPYFWFDEVTVLFVHLWRAIWQDVLCNKLRRKTQSEQLSSLLHDMVRPLPYRSYAAPFLLTHTCASGGVQNRLALVALYKLSALRLEPEWTIRINALY